MARGSLTGNPHPPWPGRSPGGTVVLPLHRAPPAQPLELAEVTLVPKAELHATLIGRGLAARLERSFDRGWLEARLHGAFDRLDWRWAPTGEFHLLCRTAQRDDGTRAEVWSVIERLQMPALAGLHRSIGRWLGSQLALPPPHVTLYVAGKAKGIGVPSERALRAWCVRSARGGRGASAACLREGGR